MMTNPLVQAYKQAPWRMQLQVIGLFLLCLVVIAAIAGVYLNISASAAATGRQIQRLEMDSETISLEIADLETQLALLTSAEHMTERAQAMGFVPADPAGTLYVVVPEYAGRQPAVLAPPPGPRVIPQPLIRASYTQSLLDWLFQAVFTPALNASSGGQR